MQLLRVNMPLNNIGMLCMPAPAAAAAVAVDVAVEAVVVLEGQRLEYVGLRVAIKL